MKTYAHRISIATALLLALGVGGSALWAAPITVIDDHFDDDVIATNTLGTGNGFSLAGGGAGTGEAGSAWFVGDFGGAVDFGNAQISSVDQFNIVNNPTNPVTVTEWTVSYAEPIRDRTTDLSGPFPGGGEADSRHQFGIISADIIGTQSPNELFRNTGSGGVYINIFYERRDDAAPDSSDDHLNVGVTGNVRVVNKAKPDFADLESTAGLVTIATFDLGMRDFNLGPQSGPNDDFMVRLITTPVGISVGFFEEDGVTPVVPVAVNGLLSSPWASLTSFIDLENIAITDEFDNGAFVFAMGQMLEVGRGFQDVDRITVTQIPEPTSLVLLCVGLALVASRRRASP